MLQNWLESQSFYWGAFALYTLLLTLGLLAPGSQLPGFVGRVDKPFHFIFLGGFSFLLALARWGSVTSYSNGRNFWYPAIVAVGYAAAMELVQIFVPGRSADILDWAAGSLGSFVGVLAYTKTFRPRTRKYNQLPADYW